MIQGDGIPLDDLQLQTGFILLDTPRIKSGVFYQESGGQHLQCSGATEGYGTD